MWASKMGRSAPWTPSTRSAMRTRVRSPTWRDRMAAMLPRRIRPSARPAEATAAIADAAGVGHRRECHAAVLPDPLLRGAAPPAHDPGARASHVERGGALEGQEPRLQRAPERV